MRINRPTMWMGMAEVAAWRSTCLRANCGALIVGHNNVISVGYNGPPSGDDHCKGNKCELTDAGGCARSVHAEINAIERALKRVGLRLPEEVEAQSYPLISFDLYCTYSPCLVCAERILQVGCDFYYRYSYRDGAGLQLLLNHPTRPGVWRVTPSGQVIDSRTNELAQA